jgi:hypothetical protein
VDSPEAMTADLADEVFFLYLRSFDSDLETTERWKVRELDSGRVRVLRGTPKTILSRLLEPVGPLVEIGKQPAPPGVVARMVRWAGGLLGGGGEHNPDLPRVQLDHKKWWEPVLPYIIHSTAIFLNPGTTEGLTRETGLILAHPKLLRRTFLIMEPTHETLLSGMWAADRAAGSRRAKCWKEIRGFYGAHRIELPEYDPKGAIISLKAPHRRLPFVGLESHPFYDLVQHKELKVLLNKRGSHDLTLGERCPCGSRRRYGRCHANKTPDF